MFVAGWRHALRSEWPFIIIIIIIILGHGSCHGVRGEGGGVATALDVLCGTTVRCWSRSATFHISAVETS